MYPSNVKVKINVSQNKPKTVIFCLPGPSFSGTFLTYWTEFVLACTQNNIIPILNQQYDPVVYYVRNKCLGGDVLRGKKQKPFNGQLHYDYIMWIDSDILFNFINFYQLLKHDLNIISGIYAVQGGNNFATVVNWDTDFFMKNGYFEFLAPKDIEGKKDLIEVAYTGFGFILIKRGVFESLEYPWFRPVFQKLSDDIEDFSSEDASFCQIIREKGYKIFIDPLVRVGHEKKIVY
jgi:hypothetical protein